MIKEAIDRILELAPPSIHTIHGRTFSNASMEQVKAPVLKPLVVHSLSSFVEYVNQSIDVKDTLDTIGIGSSIAYIHVESEIRVVAYLSARADDRAREVPIVAETYRKFEFPVGQWLDQETFVTNALVHFMPSGARDDLLKIVGNLRGENVVTAIDDGFTQKVTTAAGVTRVEQVEIPNPIGLCPYRTFAEVPQPEAMFVLRLRHVDGDIPKMALFQISDQRWREEAVVSIKNHLVNEIPRSGLPILG